MLYDLTALTNAADFVSVLNFLQVTVNIPLAEIMLLIIFAVSFGSLKGYDTMRAFTASSFIVMISSIFLWAMELLNVAYVYGSTVLVGVCIIAMYFWER